jgi:hypothetical protein
VNRDGLAIKGRFDLDTEFGTSDYRNTKGRRVSELTDLELIEAPIVVRGANDHGSGRALGGMRELQCPLACLLKCGNDGFPEIGLIGRAPVSV